jgi:hypothetical protein
VNHTQVATQFFTLQVITVFFASFITGSLLNQLALLLTSPQQVLTILGTGARRASVAMLLGMLARAAGSAARDAQALHTWLSARALQHAL